MPDVAARRRCLPTSSPPVGPSAPSQLARRRNVVPPGWKLDSAAQEGAALQRCVHRPASCCPCRRVSPPRGVCPFKARAAGASPSASRCTGPPGAWCGRQPDPYKWTPPQQGGHESSPEGTRAPVPSSGLVACQGKLGMRRGALQPQHVPGLRCRSSPLRRLPVRVPGATVQARRIDPLVASDPPSRTRTARLSLTRPRSQRARSPTERAAQSTCHPRRTPRCTGRPCSCCPAPASPRSAPRRA